MREAKVRRDAMSHERATLYKLLLVARLTFPKQTFTFDARGWTSDPVGQFALLLRNKNKKQTDFLEQSAPGQFVAWLALRREPFPQKRGNMANATGVTKAAAPLHLRHIFLAVFWSGGTVHAAAHLALLR